MGCSDGGQSKERREKKLLTSILIYNMEDL